MHPKVVITTNYTVEGTGTSHKRRKIEFILSEIKTSDEIIRLIRHAKEVNDLCIIPDGRYALSASRDGTCILWNLRDGEVLKVLKGHNDSVTSIRVTMDGKYAVSNSIDRCCILWNLESGKIVAQYVGNYYLNEIKIFSEGILGYNELNEKIVLEISKGMLLPGPALLTISYIWDFNKKSYLGPFVYCPFCGERFNPSKSLLGTILTILKTSINEEGSSPCMSLPDSAWEDPGLLSNCPKCEGALKFNPFIAGGDNFLY